MIIEDIEKTGPERILDYRQLSQSKGKGTLEDPYVIEPSERLPQHLQIRDSLYFVHFKNCNFNKLILKKCKNVKIIDCTSEVLQLDNCYNMQIRRSRFSTLLYMRKCFNNNIDGCSITLFDLIRSHENIIENCEISKAQNQYSSGNTFKNIQIPDKQKDHLLKNKLTIKILLMVMSLVLITTISGVMRVWNKDLVAAIWGLTMMSFVLLTALIASIFLYREMRQYKPNKWL